ncbi:MAG: toxin-antitoxin system YwqK family antitoxin [Pseudomonadota bacterium]
MRPRNMTAMSAGLGIVFASLAVFALAKTVAAPARPVEPAVLLDEISIDSNTGQRLYRGAVFTGAAERYGANGQRVRLEQFVHGRREGALRLWFMDGAIAYDATYRDGRREGLATSWWRNGQLRSRTMFVDDQPDGFAWSWYRTGERYKRYQYAAGQPVGLQQAWRRNGKLFSNFEYRNGRAYGLRNANMCVELADGELQLDRLDL